MTGRRVALVGAVFCAGALAVLAMVTLDGGTQVSAATVTTVATLPPEPFTPHQELTEPPVVSSRNGVLRTTLVAQTGTATAGGLDIANTQTYATGPDSTGTPRGILGPTLRVRPGETIDLTLDNRLGKPDNAPNPAKRAPDCSVAEGGHAGHAATPLPDGQQFTNLHFHGLHVTPLTRTFHGRRVFGDNVLLNLRPGRSRFRFRVPEDHPQGTYWYHAHRHMCTDDQVYRGLAGLLLIGDSRRAMPRRFHHIRTRSLALKDIQVARDSDGDPWAIPGDHDWGNPTHRTINGWVDPRMTIRPGETQLWRVANTSAAVWYRIALVDESQGVRERLQIVAEDGNQLVRPVHVTEVVLPPARRIDLLVRGQAAGQRVLKTLPFDQGRLWFPEDRLATLDLEAGPVKPVAAARPHGRRPAYPKRRGPAREFRFSIDFPKFEINGKVFNPDQVDASPTLGTVERWTLTNESTERHPFHIHQDDFRIISINGRRPPRELRGQHDTVSLPPAGRNGPSKVVIDMPFTDFHGKFVFHCHILDHEDGGMMALIDVKKRRRR